MNEKQPILKKLGENVRRHREQQNLTQEQLAEKAELDPTYISGIERGVRNCSVISLVRVATGLQVSSGSLLEGVDQ